MTTANNKQSQDDEVLAQLYKESAKDEPPAKLNYEIINYAANANKSDSKNNPVSSHVGGGWKVPLSMAASVVVVFALLVQLEQSPQLLELPPIPEVSIPTESKDKLFKIKTSPADINTEETMADDASTMKREASDLGTASDNSIDLKEKQSSNIINAPSTMRTTEQKQQPSRDRLMLEESLENSNRADKNRTEYDNEQKISAPLSPNTSEAKPIETPTFKASKPHAAKKQMQKLDNDEFISSPNSAPSETMQQRSTRHESATESNDNAGAASEIAPDISSASEQEFAPIPVEGWLLMIEQLVARKDYAEAARQLKKFKHAHPNVNVEELDAKIP